MNKQFAIETLTAAYERYKTIKPKEFYFGDFVKQYDEELDCGTVCCLWGAEPRFGVLDVKWEEIYSPLIGFSVSETPLLYWKGIIPYTLIEHLYYPISQLDGYMSLTKDSTLKQVLSLWKQSLKDLQTTKLDHLFNS